MISALSSAISRGHRNEKFSRLKINLTRDPGMMAPKPLMRFASPDRAGDSSISKVVSCKEKNDKPRWKFNVDFRRFYATIDNHSNRDRTITLTTASEPHSTNDRSAADPKDPDNVILDWLRNLFQAHRDKQIADTLGVTSSAAWKLKNGHQRLKARELLILHESLDVPLPRLGLRPAPHGAAPSATGTSDPVTLFNLAYNRMSEMEARKPQEKRLSQYDLLEQVFHIMKTIADTPQALGPKEDL